MSVTAHQVSVYAPARLHLGFMDLNGSLGRRFGSVGLTLQEFGVKLQARAGDGFHCEGAQAERALRYLHALHHEIHLPGGVHIDIEQAIPEHAGLGSGTQLVIAIGMAASRLYGMDFSPRELAFILDRGNRSGIGVGAFEQGGFLLDGGRGSVNTLPPLISRLDFPAAWRVLLILHPDRQGLHGAGEKEAFRDLPPFPESVAAHLCRLVTMMALPALAEASIDEFGSAVGELQRAVGDHFAPVQGGRFTSPLVTEVLAWLEAEGIKGIGQSSWGPTGFAVLESEVHAQKLLSELQQREPQSRLQYKICSARNRGAEVTVTQSHAVQNLPIYKTA